VFNQILGLLLPFFSREDFSQVVSLFNNLICFIPSY